MVRYYRRRRFYRRNSRPTERTVRAGSTGDISPSQQAAAYVFTASDPCTATNFRLDTGIGSGNVSSVVYALVYVPEGYDINNLNYPAVNDDLYNPTKCVLISGVLTDTVTEDHKFSRMSRKMAVGDRIALIYYNAGVNSANCSFELSFTTVH